MTKKNSIILCLLIIGISLFLGHLRHNDSVNQAIFIAKQEKSQPGTAEVKVKEEEARKKAYDAFCEFFPQQVWEQNKNNFRISSTQLKTISYSWKNMIPFYKEKPRVAWFIEFTVVPGTLDKIVGMTVKAESTIVLDAITNKVICKQMNIVL